MAALRLGHPPARRAGAGDREVTLQKPLGVVLEQDAQKNVYVAEIDAGGNADLSGKVKVGDVVKMECTVGPPSGDAVDYTVTVSIPWRCTFIELVRNCVCWSSC